MLSETVISYEAGKKFLRIGRHFSILINRWNISSCPFRSYKTHGVNIKWSCSFINVSIKGISVKMSDEAAKISHSISENMNTLDNAGLNFIFGSGLCHRRFRVICRLLLQDKIVGWERGALWRDAIILDSDEKVHFATKEQVRREWNGQVDLACFSKMSVTQMKLKV